MSYGGPPGPLGPEFEALAEQKERERDAERTKVALEAQRHAASTGVVTRFGRMLRQWLGIGRDRTQ